MKTMRFMAVLAMVCALFCIGCSDDSSKKSTREKDRNARSALSGIKDDAVLLRIGTNDFTKADFMRLCSLRRQFLELANKGNLKDMKANVDPTVVEMHTLDAYPSKTMTETVLREYAATNGIRATDADRREARQAFQLGCQNDFVSWNAFVKNFEDEAREQLDEEIESAALLGAIRRDFFTRNKIVVSDEEVADCKKWTADYNARAMMTNAVIWATASNVWKSIVAGTTTLEEAANKYSEDENDVENGEWASFSLDAFSDEPELAKTISRMSPGDITPPIEGDNGLMILKLVAIEKGEKPSEPLRFTLSRIFFHLPEFYSLVAEEDLKREMLTTKKEKTFAAFVEALTKAVKLEYVSGEDIFKRAHDAARSPMSSVM